MAAGCNASIRSVAFQRVIREAATRTRSQVARKPAPARQDGVYSIWTARAYTVALVSTLCLAVIGAVAVCPGVAANQDEVR